ncbi:cbb3-type cytochrome oxidase assembly protein CcoS [Jiella marina]|uniref:cbb3-type cytochrome oxidase assembly protein CcoS n=1 Tax=Jiella sp. LLJ827 TaxID=2917712 RepID=UPI0021014BF9|nr:cbb3-type cytochrome oxidase assembly protein CcoS [Jiella sp. LLJ827]MCQ0988535.1 cbb3-type cytochrome oxidase assembly protein CcoS [Jiella sp. LLJ827]
MNVLLLLVPVALLMGLAGLAAFVWSVRNRQYEDLDGAAWRILNDEDESGNAPADRRPG